MREFNSKLLTDLFFIVFVTHGTCAVSYNVTNKIQFKEHFYLTEHIAIGECMNEQPYYNLLPNQELTMEFIAIVPTFVLWCKLDNTEYHELKHFETVNDQIYNKTITIQDVGQKSGELSCKFYYETIEKYEIRLYLWCYTQIHIIDDSKIVKPITSSVTSWISAEVSANLFQPYLEREVIFYDNSTVVFNCRYRNPDYARSLKAKGVYNNHKTDLNMAVRNYSHQIWPLTSLKKEFDGTVLSCVETDTYANVTYETTIKFVYRENYTFPYSGEGYEYRDSTVQNTSHRITFRTKTSLGDVLSTTECFNEQPSYRVLRDSLLIVTVRPDIMLTARWCILNDAKFLLLLSTTTSPGGNGTEDVYYVNIKIPNVGYTSGYLMCQMQYQGKDIGLCRTYIDIIDGNTSSNSTKTKKYSSLIEAVVNIDEKDNSFKTAELVFRDNDSLVIDCQFGGEEYEHSLVFKDSKEHSTLLRGSNMPFVWGPIDELNITFDYTQFVCLDRHKITNTTRETTLWLMSNYYNPISRVLGQYWASIIASTSMLVVLMISIIIAYLWRTGKCTRRRGAPTSMVQRPDSVVSDDYDNVYDVPYELRIKRERIFELMRKEAQGPKKPAPPPLESLPTRNNNMSAVQLRSVLVHEDSLIPQSDLELLQIDSEGYQIPVPPRLLP